MLCHDQTEGLPDLKPCDVSQMLANEELGAPDMMLEGFNLGRGLGSEDPTERRRFEVLTQAVRCWHILEYDHVALTSDSQGQFHEGDTYVVQWRYLINNIGRSLSGEVSKFFSAGRERYAYFFWQGSQSSITEKGASALMTVELDREMGPHLRKLCPSPYKKGLQEHCEIASIYEKF
ncbi:SVIL [Cordylochernes scorpioides]|uniref:SVIL n=1 Tax=Cordylochernes scorpioides TaxID=51811 RepID=A0ABY6KGQ1_9ARAC|nr:SVIL [Cordylochernes scorpioides]